MLPSRKPPESISAKGSACICSAPARTIPAGGGDIDLYIQTDLADVEKVVKAEIQFLAELKRRIGDQKIDVLIRNSPDPSNSSHRASRETAPAKAPAGD